MARSLLLIVNPAAGMGKGRLLAEQIAALYADAGWGCQACETAGAGDADRFAREHACAHDLVLCVGGDGTLSETLGGMIAARGAPPLCYVPMGSTNDLATSAGLPHDPLAAAKVGLTGTPHWMDAGSFNNRVFSYVACFGAFSRTSYATDRALKNRIGHLAYVLTGAQELAHLQSYPVHISCDGETLAGDYLFGAICNTRSLGGTLKLPLERDALQDGLHEIMLVRMPESLGDLSGLALALLSGTYDHPLLEGRSIRQADLRMPAPMPWSLDGERADAGISVQFRNLHHAYRLMLPD